MHDTKKTALQHAADIVLPIALYYVVSNIALYLLNFVVQYVAQSLFADGAVWIRAHASAIRVADNAAAMCIGAFCVRRQLLQETVGGGETIAVSPRRVAAGWIKAGAAAFKKEWKRYLPLIVCGAGAALLLNYLAGLAQLTARDETYQEVAAVQYAVPLWLGLVAYGIVSPIVEESIFRGILYLKCRRYLGKPVLAAVFSALLFGVLHGNLVQGAYGFLMGLVIIWFYERYQRFLAAVLFHAAANVSVFLFSYGGWK